ncbi:Carboxypeptidase regulatory-like domain protein, partial [Thermoplasmatales archaeon SCGC AB-539-C06]
TATLDGFDIHEESMFVAPGDTRYNISKPKLSSIDGTVFYDANDNETYEVGEEMADAVVNLVYSKTNNIVETVTADMNGTYRFAQLIPGDYKINVTKINSTTMRIEYEIEEDAILEENETKTLDVPIKLAKIKVTGSTLYNNNSVIFIDLML